MESIWTILGLEPTRDVAAIRQAYARQVRDCHPEENPEGFLRLRQAYQAALDWAEQDCASAPELPRSGNEGEENGWFLPEEEPEAFEKNPFRDGAAIRQFVELYTGKQRRNPGLWMDYFTSDVLLDAAWDGRFTHLMLEEVSRVEQELPPPREFLLWLTVVYRFSVREQLVLDRERMQVNHPGRNVQLHPEADFDGMKSILAIAAKGPVPKQLKHNELAIQNSFQDYRHLVTLADSGVWSEQALEEFKWIVGRYSSAYIRERCEQRTSPDCERHPAGLRVFVHFFRRRDLPEQLYRIVWEKFDLKSAVMGRGKVLYGPLREIAIERVPGLAGEQRENFFQLNLERDACFARIQADPARTEAELDALFAGDSLQQALRSRRFVEEQLVYYYNWLNSLAPEGCIRRLAEFYRAHPDIPGWDRVVEHAERELERREAERQREEEQREEERLPEKPDPSLIMGALNAVRVQPVAGLERAFCRLCSPEYDPDEWDGEDLEEEDMQILPPGLFEGGNRRKPFTKEDLSALLDRYAQGELERLELEICGNLLVLVRDGDQYGCFCFEPGYDTWYSILSQVDVYTTVDCKDVKSYPFGMGMLESYNIHENTDLILGQLNLVFRQLTQGRPRTREGSVWLWSSHTSQQNSGFKRRMAMQKFAKIPYHRASEYVLSKFVVSKQPFQVESVTPEGERTVENLQPGLYGLAAGALVRFFQKKLARVRLSWDLKRPGGTVRRHLVLLKEGEQFMMAWLQDDKEQAGFYAIDAPRIFGGKVYPACLVHQELGRIRNGVDLILDDMTCTELVTDRFGEFVPDDRPYAQVRAELLGEEG